VKNLHSKDARSFQRSNMDKLNGLIFLNLNFKPTVWFVHNLTVETIQVFLECVANRFILDNGLLDY